MASRRTLRLLQAGCFASSFDRFSVAPLLLLLAADLDVTLADATSAATLYFFAYGCMQSVWAVVSDRLGRVRTLRLAFALAALTGLASAVAPGLEALLVARTLAGASFAAAVPGAMVYVGDTVPTETRQAALADLMSGAAVGMAVSTAGAAALGELVSWRAAFAVTALVAAALVGALGSVPEPPAAPRTSVPRALQVVLRDRWALLVLALAFGEGMVLVGFLTFFPLTLQADGLGTTAAGAVVTVFGVATIAFATLVKRLTRRLRPARLSLVGTVCGVLAYAWLALSPHLLGVVAACVLLGASRAFLHSTLQAWITDVVPAQRATAVSLFSSLMFTGSAAATALGGPLVADADFVPLYLLALAITVPLGTAATTARARYDGRRP